MRAQANPWIFQITRCMEASIVWKQALCGTRPCIKAGVRLQRRSAEEALSGSRTGVAGVVLKRRCVKAGVVLKRR